MKYLSHITILALLVVIVFGQAMAGGKNGKISAREITDQDKRKAEYIYLQAQAYKTQDSLAAFYDLIKYAYELDSTNTAISFYYGYLILRKDNITDADK